jgi:DNA-directed DNA polymerase III PolC
MLDGAARIGETVGAAVADGQPAIGITDHGNMYGILDFYRECRSQGVKPILGTEAYMAHDSRHERPARRGRVDDTGGDSDSGKKLYYHLTLLAEDNAGYRNLIQLASRAFMEGYYYKPRVDWETLSDHAEGLIATTGCLGGQVLQSLLQGDMEGAVAKAGRLQDIFGRDNLFVELQDHGIAEQHKTNPQLLEIARRIGAPLLATNDSHYVHRGDAVAHDALLCVQTGSLMSDPNRFKFHGDEHYLKSAAEMRSLFQEVPEACDNTLWIAERANVEIDFGKPQLPNFPLPEGFASDADYLRHLTFEGARERWGASMPDAATERLAYELKVVEDMGFSSYFLIVWDLIAHARRSGIRVGPGRGSAAGCAVAYCLRITDLDPIRYDLLFERFLNPSRISMPDIDMDFDSRYRDEMIRYAAERYGRDHVAQIVTFSTIKARAAVRDAARVLGHPYGVGDRVAKAMPPLIMGRDTPLYACLEPHPKYDDGYKMAGELREMYEADPDTRQVIDVAKGLEGLRRQDGIHAAAVVITKEPLTEYLPIQRKPENGQAVEDAPVVTQYEMHGVEDLGLLKMDFLGLRNLDVITDTVEVIRRTRGVELDIDTVPLDDQPTYDLLARGDSIGVFQLEGGPMRALIRSLAPTCFEDVAALVALYRPGPMAANMHNDYADRKNGRKPVAYLHPDAEEILADTWGLMIYQESVMRIAQKFAGYSLAEADNLRKACLPKGSRILTPAHGYVPIERLLGLADHRAQTIDAETGLVRHEEVEDVWSVGVKPVLRLTTATGHRIEATDNHPFLVDGRWVELGQVRPGDRVAVARRADSEGGGRVTTPEVELAALLLAGVPAGGRRARPRTARFRTGDAEIVAAYRKAFAARFGYPPSARRARGSLRELHLTRREHASLAPLIGRPGLDPAARRIPSRVINAPRPNLERFLGLWFCAEGWADADGAHLGAPGASVARSLKRMLLRCGVVGELAEVAVPGHGTRWRVSVRGGEQAKAFARLVEPHLTERKVRAVAHWLVEGGAGHPAPLGDGEGDLGWDVVTAVEPVGGVECFDFRMAEPERPYAVVEDFVVHNCGKKIRELIAKEREKFVAGCDATGYGADLGNEWFDIIEPFADYAFNKSHSFGYGYVAYQTAYLKANYPAEYLAALLTSVKASLEKAAVYLAECRAMGITVEVPDINRSASDFTPVIEGEGDDQRLGIIFGLSAVRNVGEGLVAHIVAEREAGGPFADFYDFCERVDPQVLNKRTVESLIKAGAFDDVGHPRKGLLTVFEQIVDHTLARRRERDMGIMTLFGDAGDGDGLGDFERTAVPDVEFNKRDRLAFEKEMLGLYVSDHPLLGAEAALARRTDAAIDELADIEDGALKTVGGVITGLQKKWTRKGDLMAVFTLEDLRSSVEVMVFPRTMTEHGHKLADDAVVVVRARVDRRDDAPKLIAQAIDAVEVAEGGLAEPLRLRVPPQLLSEATVADLKSILSEHPGVAPVVLHLGERQVVRLPDQWNVDTTNGLLGRLRVVLGAGAIVT